MSLIARLSLSFSLLLPSFLSLLMSHEDINPDADLEQSVLVAGQL